MYFLRRIASLFIRITPAHPPAPLPEPPPAPRPEPIPDSATVSSEVVAAVNAERAARRLGPLAIDERLAELSATWATEMARRSRLTHGDFSGRIASVLPNTAAAENIAEGPSGSAGAVAVWMNSAPHRANILGPFSIAGAGRATSDDGTVYWCVDFGAP